MKCKDCKYYEADANPKYKGSCHRYPPTGSVKQSDNNSGFVTVDPDKWCGEGDKK